MSTTVIVSSVLTIFITYAECVSNGEKRKNDFKIATTTKFE